MKRSNLPRRSTTTTSEVETQTQQGMHFGVMQQVVGTHIGLIRVVWVGQVLMVYDWICETVLFFVWICYSFFHWPFVSISS